MRRDRSRSRRETGKRAGEALESSASKHGGQRRVGGSQIGRRGGPGEGREAWEYSRTGPAPELWKRLERWERPVTSRHAQIGTVLECSAAFGRGRPCS